MIGRTTATRGGAGRSRSVAHLGVATGFQLYEILVVLAIAGLVTVAGLPALLDWTRALRLRVAAAEVAASLRAARSQAIRRGVRVGVRFSSGADEGISWSLHRDGDGDGVRTADIETGVDPKLGVRRHLAHVGRRVRFGFPPGPPPPDPAEPGRRLDRLDDPIRLGRSDIASFNSMGEATAGSIYLTDGRRGLVAIRLFGRTGKIRVLTLDPERMLWE